VVRLRGFTLLELLVVISIIGILAAVLIPSLLAAKNDAYNARAKAELKEIDTALELYANDHGGYPPDADRGLPPGLETYLGPGTWPAAPWPGSVYDWDNWAPSDLSYPPYQQVYQISIRFCPLNEPDNCQFPDEPWAKDFDYYSAEYYCVSGPCRAHSSEPVDYPGYCVNC
jgi:prepilin-type N-terminal cleavage/methylation domain-containing protein